MTTELVSYCSFANSLEKDVHNPSQYTGVFMALGVLYKDTSACSCLCRHWNIN